MTRVEVTVQICNGVPGSVPSMKSHGFQSQLKLSRVAATLAAIRILLSSGKVYCGVAIELPLDDFDGIISFSGYASNYVSRALTMCNNMQIRKLQG